MSEPHQKAKEAFRNEIIDLIRFLSPSAEVKVENELNLTINGFPLDISDLYKMHLQDSEKCRELAMNYIEQIVNGGGHELKIIDNSEFIDLAHRIMPRVVSLSFVEKAPQGSLVYLPWINGCAISFVIDCEETTVFVRSKNIAEWGIKDLEDLYLIALRNLEESSEYLEVDTVSIKDQDSEKNIASLCIINKQDSYDSARILLPSMRDKIMKILGGPFYAGIPSRDLFVAVSMDSEKAVETIREKIEKDSETLPYPVSDKMFICVQDGVAPANFEI